MAQVFSSIPSPDLLIIHLIGFGFGFFEKTRANFFLPQSISLRQSISPRQCISLRYNFPSEKLARVFSEILSPDLLITHLMGYGYPYEEKTRADFFCPMSISARQCISPRYTFQVYPYPVRPVCTVRYMPSRQSAQARFSPSDSHFHQVKISNPGNGFFRYLKVF